MKVLINFYNRFIRGIFLYPHSILPRKNYKSKINFDEHLLENEFILVRRTTKNPNEAFDELGYVRVDALIENLRDVPGMSMNLFGGMFDETHLKYIPKGIGANIWDNNKSVKLWGNGNSFEIINVAYPIYFFLSKIHKQQIPFLRRKDDPNVKKLYQALKKKLPEQENIDSEGYSSVSHEPVQLNYWHVEFNLLDNRTNQHVKRDKIRREGSNYWQNNLAKTALTDILIANAKGELDNIEDFTINENIYITA